MRYKSLFLMITMLLLCGCGSTFRDKVETQTIRINRHDAAGKAIKQGFLSRKRVIEEIKYQREDGTYNVEEVDVSGWDVSPPPLPQETKKP